MKHHSPMNKYEREKFETHRNECHYLPSVKKTLFQKNLNLTLNTKHKELHFCNPHGHLGTFVFANEVLTRRQLEEEQIFSDVANQSGSTLSGFCTENQFNPAFASIPLKTQYL